MTSRAAGWPSDGPTAAQLKEFFIQIGDGRVTKRNFQIYLRTKWAVPRVTLDSPLEEVELSVKVYNTLRTRGIETVGDLVAKTESELAAFPNFGLKSITEVKEVLAEHGLALRGSETSVLTDKPEIDFGDAIEKLLELVRTVNHRLVILEIVTRDSQYTTHREEQNELGATAASLIDQLYTLLGAAPHEG